MVTVVLGSSNVMVGIPCNYVEMHHTLRNPNIWNIWILASLKLKLLNVELVKVMERSKRDRLVTIGFRTPRII